MRASNSQGNSDWSLWSEGRCRSRKDGNVATPIFAAPIWCRLFGPVRCLECREEMQPKWHLTPEAPTASRCEAGISICPSKNKGTPSFQTDQNKLFYWKPFRNEDGDEIEPLTSSDSPTSIKLVPCMKLIRNFNELMQWCNRFFLYFDDFFSSEINSKWWKVQEWDEPCSQGAPIIGYRVQCPPKIDLSRRLIISSLDLPSGRYSLDPAEGVDDTITSLHRLSGWKLWNRISKPKPKPSEI